MRFVSLLILTPGSWKSDVSSYESFKFCIGVCTYINQRRNANTAPENDSFARRAMTDSSISIGVGVTHLLGAEFLS